MLLQWSNYLVTEETRPKGDPKYRLAKEKPWLSRKADVKDISQVKSVLDDFWSEVMLVVVRATRACKSRKARCHITSTRATVSFHEEKAAFQVTMIMFYYTIHTVKGISEILKLQTSTFGLDIFVSLGLYLGPNSQSNSCMKAHATIRRQTQPHEAERRRHASPSGATSLFLSLSIIPSFPYVK